MRTNVCGRAAARFDKCLTAAALLAAAARVGAAPVDAAPAPAAAAETTVLGCPDDNDSLTCRLRRADARLRRQFEGSGPLGIVWGGLLMADLAGPNSPLVDDNNVQLRRLRMGFDRRFNEWTVRGYAEYKTGRFEVEELLAQRSLWDGRLVLGNQTEPFGLERATGVAATTQLERALPAALTPGLDVGALYARRDGNWYWAIGAFAANSPNDGLQNKGAAVDGRLAWAQTGDEHVRHVGAAVSLRPQSSDNEIRFRSYPEVALSNVYLVDTGKFSGVERIRRAGVEYAEVAGAWSWQAESIALHLARGAGMPDLAFHGGYAELSWFPWDGRRRYDAQQARFARVDDAGRATWQFSVRVSRIDLSSHEIDGGRETNLTFAANWYLTPRARLGANLVKVLRLDGGPLDGSAQGDYALVARLQYDFL